MRAQILQTISQLVFLTGLEDVNLVYQKNSEIKMKFSAILIDLHSQG